MLHYHYDSANDYNLSERHHNFFCAACYHNSTPSHDLGAHHYLTGNHQCAARPRRQLLYLPCAS